jgi:hypothetical protein
MIPPPVFLAMHARSGVVGLNVISAALGADPRTRAAPVRFLHRADELARRRGSP